MEITFKNKKIKKVCEDASFAERKYGKRTAELLHQRIDEIQIAHILEIVDYH